MKAPRNPWARVVELMEDDSNCSDFVLLSAVRELRKRVREVAELRTQLKAARDALAVWQGRAREAERRQRVAEGRNAPRRDPKALAQILAMHLHGAGCPHTRYQIKIALERWAEGSIGLADDVAETARELRESAKAEAKRRGVLRTEQAKEFRRFGWLQAAEALKKRARSEAETALLCAVSRWLWRQLDTLTGGEEYKKLHPASDQTYGLRGIAEI